MDTYQMGLLIRALMLVATICPLVIAGVLVALREKRRVLHLGGDLSTNSSQRPAVMQDRLRYAANREPLEANDSEGSAPRMERRAA